MVGQREFTCQGLHSLVERVLGQVFTGMQVKYRLGDFFRGKHFQHRLHGGDTYTCRDEYHRFVALHIMKITSRWEYIQHVAHIHLVM